MSTTTKNFLKNYGDVGMTGLRSTGTRYVVWNVNVTKVQSLNFEFT